MVRWGGAGWGPFTRGYSCGGCGLGSSRSKDPVPQGPMGSAQVILATVSRRDARGARRGRRSEPS
eukprot:7737965-Lingulodinium_polyedra.AAC.1